MYGKRASHISSMLGISDSVRVLNVPSPTSIGGDSGQSRSTRNAQSRGEVHVGSRRGDRRRWRCRHRVRGHGRARPRRCHAGLRFDSLDRDAGQAGRHFLRISSAGRGSTRCPSPDRAIMPNSPTIHSKHDDQGVVALEFVLVAPFLIALIFAIASFGLFFSNKVDVTSTARDAARTLALRQTPTYPTGMIGSIVGSPCAAGDTDHNVTVNVTTTYT